MYFIALIIKRVAHESAHNQILLNGTGGDAHVLLDLLVAPFCKGARLHAAVERRQFEWRELLLQVFDSLPVG